MIHVQKDINSKPFSLCELFFDHRWRARYAWLAKIGMSSQSMSEQVPHCQIFLVYWLCCCKYTKRHFVFRRLFFFFYICHTRLIGRYPRNSHYTSVMYISEYFPYMQLFYLYRICTWTPENRLHVWLKYQPGGGLKFLTFGRGGSKQMAGLKGP